MKTIYTVSYAPRFEIGAGVRTGQNVTFWHVLPITTPTAEYCENKLLIATMQTTCGFLIHIKCIFHKMYADISKSYLAIYEKNEEFIAFKDEIFRC